MVSPRRLSWLLLAGLIAGYVAHYWHLQRGHIDFFTDQCESSRAALAAVRVLPAPDFHLRHFEGGNPLHQMTLNTRFSEECMVETYGSIRADCMKP